ncbi:FRG domain-containing protein [Agreia sp. Leaf244]|uniref:FRG domain-containing protein n=1 Tax=Agreia sp. Leaf244 TaxID=1736305 RepID=UPI00138F64E7|nr:FRG domain-containing protein [Agreia sp. Leaf244]
MPITEVILKDVPELVSWALAQTPTKQFWFRGQGCETQGLVPSLWRRLSPKPLDLTAVPASRVLEVEQRLLTRFRQRSLPYWPAGYPQSDWEHLFAMQHYGLPTRLLDWTTNLLVGVYFALDHDPTRCACGTGKCMPTLWMLDPILLNQSNPRFDGIPVNILATSDDVLDPWQPGVDPGTLGPAPIALYGTHNSDRIAAQQGSFTVAGKTIEPLDVIVADIPDVLKKISLSADRKTLGAQLSLMGVTQSTIYPGLAQLAQDIALEEID